MNKRELTKAKRDIESMTNKDVFVDFSGTVKLTDKTMFVYIGNNLGHHTSTIKFSEWLALSDNEKSDYMIEDISKEISLGEVDWEQIDIVTQ